MKIEDVTFTVVDRADGPYSAEQWWAFVDSTADCHVVGEDGSRSCF